MTSLTERITADQITATATYRDNGAPSYIEGDFTRADWWDVTLYRDGQSLTVPFGMGTGHHGAEPTALDVLSCLVSDAAGVENARDFADWADEYGFDTDSRKAERSYNATVAQAEQLRGFLGDLYETYLWDTEND